MSGERAPKVTRVNTVTVECSKTGPRQEDGEGNTYQPYCLADIEAWCAELRRLGAADDLVPPDVDGLWVTLGVAGPGG